MMNPYTSEIKQLFLKSIKLHLGKGPETVKVSILEHIIVIDIKGSLTTIETSLLRSIPDNSRMIIKYIREQLFEAAIDYYRSEIQSITNIGDLKIESYMFDIDFNNDRETLVLICNKPLCQSGD